MYYRNAQAAVVVYDVTKAASLDKAKSWVKELQRQANPNIVIALAGNKLDLVTASSASATATATAEAEDESDDATATPGESPEQDTSMSLEDARRVPTEDARNYATESGLLFFEVSAKNGEGIVEMFTEIGMLFQHPMVYPFKYFIKRRRYPLITSLHQLAVPMLLEMESPQRKRRATLTYNNKTNLIALVIVDGFAHRYYICILCYFRLLFSPS